MAYTYAGALYASPNDIRAENSSGFLVSPTVVQVCDQGTTNPIVLYSDRNRTSTAPNGPMSIGVAIGATGVDVAGGLYGYAEVGHYTLLIGGVPYPLTVYPDPDEPPQSVSSPSSLQPVTADTTNNTQNGVTIPGITVPLVAGAGVVYVVGKLTVASTSASNITLNATAPDLNGYMNFWAYGPADSVTNPGGAVNSIPGMGNWYNAVMSGGTSVLSGWFGGFTTGGSRQTIQFGCEASSPTAGNLSFAFHQKTAGAGPTVVYASSSYVTVYRT